MRLACLLLTAVALAACGAGGPSEAEAETKRDGQAAPLPMTLDAAFGTAFKGNAKRDTERGTLVFKPGKLLRVGERIVLISTGTNSDDCHACSGALSVHYLEARGNGWQVVRESLTASGGGTWGVAASEWSVSTTLLSYPVLYAEGGGTWQGCTSVSADLLPLLPQGPGTPVVIPIAFDNGGALEAPETGEGRIVDVVKDKGFKIRFTGESGGEPWTATDTYVWTGYAFELRGNRSLETC